MKAPPAEWPDEDGRRVELVGSPLRSWAMIAGHAHVRRSVCGSASKRLDLDLEPGISQARGRGTRVASIAGHPVLPAPRRHPEAVDEDDGVGWVRIGAHGVAPSRAAGGGCAGVAFDERQHVRAQLFVGVRDPVRARRGRTGEEVAPLIISAEALPPTLSGMTCSPSPGPAVSDEIRRTSAAGRRSSSAGRARGRRRGRPGWPACSDRATGSRTRCTRSGPRLRRSSSAIRSSIRALQPLDRRDQSRLVGRAVRRAAWRARRRSPPASGPTRWAKTMNAIRRSTGRG